MRLNRSVGLLLAVIPLLAVWWWHDVPPAAPAEQVFAPSLRQTSIDGLPTATVNGVMSLKQLKALFDYYLSTLGERQLPDVKAEVEKQLAQRLSGQALADAKDVFRRYLAYLEALTGVEKQLPAAKGLDAMEARLQLLQQTRARYFKPQEIQELFGPDDEMDRFVLQRMRIMQRGDLTAAEKKQMLDKLEATLSPQQQQWRSQATQHLTLLESEKALLQRGGSASELQALRTQAVGGEAAQRLAALDAEQGAWQDKLQQWQREREQLARDASLSELQRQQALQTLEQKLFSDNERKRLQAYQ